MKMRLMQTMQHGDGKYLGSEEFFAIEKPEEFSITQEELDAKKEEFFARGGRVEKVGCYHLSAQINPIKDNDTRSIIDSIRAEVDSNLSASRRHLRTSLYGD
tara:strand:- start:910 stop:1215 length:306 start_codon:yes stop_codon:yes gene_type:complete